jgi:hypothetical protein
VVAVAIAMTAVAMTGTASAAATRSEYVVQVDRVCATTTQGFGRLGSRLKILFNLKGYAGTPAPGRPTPTKKQLRQRRNRFINQLSRLLANLNRAQGSATEQIALIAPAPGDEAAVAQWIAGLRQYETLMASSIRSLRHHKPRLALGFQRQATDALNAGGAAVQSFGIAVCLNSLPAI